MAKTIPAGWQEKTLGKVCKISSGNSAPQLISLFENGKYPFFRTSDVGSIHFGNIYSSHDYLNDNGIKGLRLFKKGTILFPKSGASTFLNHRVKMACDGYVVSHLAAIIACNKVINEDYLLYFLSIIDSKKLIQDGNYPSLNLSVISSIKIRFPPLSEQERIVAKLDKAFEAIGKAKAIAENNLKNAKELFESSLNKAFTENTNDWEEKTLGEVCKIISGTTPDTSNQDFWGKGNYWVTPAEINEDDLYIRKTAREITDLAVESCSLRKLPRGTIIFSSRAPIGKIAISDVNTLYCNQGFKNFICSKNIYNKFLYYFLLKNKKYLISLGKGTTFKEVSKSIVSAVKIRFPSIPDQQNIVARLDKLHEQTKQLEAFYSQKIKNFDELKQSILKRAFRGEL